MIQQNVKLIEPTAELETEFLAMANDHRICGDERYRVALENVSAYLESLAIAALGKNLPLDRVRENEFWLVSDNCVIGRSKLRHWLIPASEHEGGHIGYDIRPSERRKGYGMLILKLTMEKAKDLNLCRVRLTCDADNIASARIIEKYGGVLSGRAISKKNGKPILQYWIEI
jgi:predicted acetyltransferase